MIPFATEMLLSAVIAATPADTARVDSTAAAAVPSDERAAAVNAGGHDEAGVTYLVPELEGAGFHVSNDKSRFRHRISFSPAMGQLGSEDLFAFRVGYSPNTWLGYEINLGHNPAASLHALVHSFNVILRYPLPWRAQPYVTAGYGMMTVFPGQAINADRVTKNTLLAGAGLELYIRDDVAIRGEIRGATVLGQQLGVDGTVAYGYREYTIGFAFYRNLGG